MKPQTQISPLLADLLPCVVVETNCRGEIIFVNDRWTAVSGYSLEETLGHPWTHFVNEISFLELVSQMNDFWFSKESTIKFSTTIEHKKGSARDLEVKLSKLYTNRGRLRGLVATFLDISVYKQTNNVLAEKRRALSAVLKSIENVVIEFDYEGRVRNLWGSEKEVQSVGKSDGTNPRVEIFSLIAPAFLEEFKTRWRAVSTTKSAQSLELQLLGDEKYYLGRISLVSTDPDPSYILSVRDITEFKIMSDQLAHASHLSALGEMAASIAHEINNPLTVILGRSGELRSREFKSEREQCLAKENFAKIHDTAQKITQIIRGFKNYSRDTSQEEKLPTSMGAVVEDVLGICGDNLRNQKIALRQDLEPATLPLQGVRVGQVILNLLSNAKDAIKDLPEKWIVIEGKVVGNFYELRVRDSGPGIPEHLRAKIMQPFFTTKPVGEGTGLGLSISKKIIEEQHQGEFTLDLTAPSTCFLLRFPLT